jgi:hypothetical protein
LREAQTLNDADGTIQQSQTPKRPALPHTSATKHDANQPEANHAITFKLDKTMGARHHSSVSRLFRNQIHAGYYEYEAWDMSLTEAKHEPRVSLRTFRKIQMRLAKKPKLSSRKGRRRSFSVAGLCRLRGFWRSSYSCLV